MSIEIERKFLVLSDAWRSGAVRSERLVDGLIASTGGRKVRVRIYHDRATLTIKSPAVGISRAEFEYQIPAEDAQELIANHCNGLILSKVRYDVPFAGFTWQVDCYEGILAGVVIAEIELRTESAKFTIPEWVGAEVTGRPEYKKINMLRAVQAGCAVFDH